MNSTRIARIHGPDGEFTMKRAYAKRAGNFCWRAKEVDGENSVVRIEGHTMLSEQRSLGGELAGRVLGHGGVSAEPGRISGPFSFFPL